MATYEYKTLKEKYNDFRNPLVVITVGGKNIVKNDLKLVITDIEVDLTAGLEASIASFSILNAYDNLEDKFLTDKVSKYIRLGSKLCLLLVPPSNQPLYL